MDKLKYIKLENEDGSYSESIPLSVDSDYVDVNGNILTNILAEKATKSEISAIASGSPAGIYSTVTELINADPDHSKIYLILADGKWYYYDSTLSSWIEGGLYQSTEIASGSIGALETNTDTSRNVDFLKTALSQNYNKFVVSEFENGYITPSNGNNEDSIYTVRNKIYHQLESKNIIFKSSLNILRWRYYAYNFDNSFDRTNSSNWLAINDSFVPLANKKYRFAIGTNNSTAIDMNYLSKCGIFYEEDYIEKNIDSIIENEKDIFGYYDTNYNYLLFLTNSKNNVMEAKKLSNYEEGTITYTNGNNLDGFPNCMRNKKAIEIKNCIIINLKPDKYRLRLIYYNTLGGYNNETFQGSTNWYQQPVTKIQNENFSNHSIYSRLIIYAPNETTINFEDALSNILIINTEDKMNFKKPFIDIMAHQGGIGLDTSVPSNTLNAFSNCAKYDFTGFETDVRKTSDGVFVITHDVERTTTGGVTININQTTYADLQNMQFYADSSIKIPTLDETLKNAKINGMKVDIELKDSFSQSEINSICNLVKQNSMENHVVFSSFITTNLLYVRDIFPNIKVIIPMNEIIDPSTIESSENYLNYRTLRDQGKTLLSMTNTTIADNVQYIKTYISNGFNIRICYYGTDVLEILNLIEYADTILLNSEDLYSILYYLR